MASVFQRLLQVQYTVQNELLRKDNVVGVAVGFKESGGVITNQPAVVVLVEEKKASSTLSSEDKIPSQINGIPTDVFESGKILAQNATNPRGRFRPIPAGVSIGHYKVTAGTLGAFVTDRRTGERFILSNNHVLANSNEALAGDAILQPGTMDGGQNPADAVARLERFIALHYIEGDVNPPEPPKPTPNPTPSPTPSPDPSGCSPLSILMSISKLFGGQSSSGGMEATPRTGASGSAQTVTSPVVKTATATAAVKENAVDCAIAKLLDPSQFGSEILNIGVVSGTKAPAIGMRVRKSGRTTGYTEGNITLLNATVNVGYTTSKGPRTARFVGQVITQPMSQGGDSGSLIVDATENKAVGLLFAGSNAATIFTPINTVLEALKVNI